MKLKLILITTTILLSSTYSPLLTLGSNPLKLPILSWSLMPNVTFNQRECLMCRFSVSLVNYAISSQKGSDQVYRFANTFCQLAHIESPLVCSNITRLFNHEIVKVLSNGIITPNQVCGYLSNNTCGHYHDPMADWEVNLNASTSLNQEELEKLRLIHQNVDASERQRINEKAYGIVHISDTHVDLKYKEGSISNCDEPLCCRHNSTNPIEGMANIEAGYWGSYAACDVPLRTLESALKKINETIRKQENGLNIEYIIWTGDIQPHDVWSQDKKTAIETYDTVFEKIFQLLPNVKILPTFGNHEMVPVDSFSPSNLLYIARDDSPEWVYRKLDSFWSRWLPEETVKTITKDGFYATIIKPGLKVISLNTNFCHNKNFWLYINSTDPGNQLQWLIHELQISELEHEQVHLIGHIPPGTDDCLKVWSKNFNKILRRYAKTITGQFFGHTHSNEFEIFYDKEGPVQASQVDSGLNLNEASQGSPKPISVGLIGPSITTFVDLNPSFRVYTIEPSKAFSPVQFDTYFMNLTAANLLAGPDSNGSFVQTEPQWERVNFADVFNVTDILPQTLHNLLLEMVDELKDYAQNPVKFAANSLNLNIAGKEQLVSKQKERLELKQKRKQKSSLKAMQAPSDESKLYKLFKMYHNYSDMYGRDLFNKLSLDEKKAFLCKFFTGQSHNRELCKLFISDNANFNYISVV